jgi:Nif-specific regulatory protein
VPHDGARLRLLYDLGCAFAARLELDELIPLVISKCREVLEAEGAAILLLDRDRGELYFPYVAEADPEVASSLTQVRFPAEQGIAGAVLKSGEPLRLDDAASDPRFYRDVDRQTGLATRDLLAVPLLTRHGPVGLIEVVNHRGGTPFGDADLEFLSALAGSVAVAIENARLWADMKATAAELRDQLGTFRRDLAHRERFDLVGSGARMEEVFRLMESASASPITVLIQGETGTGKELVARGIHRASARATQPFVAVNCAALPETLLESELFGHRRGAFTGATQDRRGLFEAASGGTVFLDEVGEMPLTMQAKLLRVLQEGEVMPVGERAPRRIDVRVIAATNRDLLESIEQRTFRDDLYYRLSAFPIYVPPLRERREDIPSLANRFLASAAERHGKHVPGINPNALAALMGAAWPGNVRELQNEIERCVALALAGESIGPTHLSARLLTAAADSAGESRPPAAAAPQGNEDLRNARTAFEVEFIAKVLRQHRGNVSHAAEALGISRVALQKKMKDYGLR